MGRSQYSGEAQERDVQIRTAVTTGLSATGLIVTGLLVGSRVNLLPVGASSNAPTYDSLFQVLLTISTTLFLGIAIVLAYSLIRFRRKPADTADGIPLEGNLPLEIVWTAIPAIVILFVGIYSYDIYDRMGGMTPLHHSMDDHAEMLADFDKSSASQASDSSGQRIWGGIGPAIPAAESGSQPMAQPLAVDVTAMQFAFIFQYPDDGITAGELHVPTGQPIQLHMEARDVIHAFWVPEFRLKQDIIPGQPTELSFTATRPGNYPLICAELCGPYHGGMRTRVIVHDPDDYSSWVAQNRPATAT